MNIKLDKELDLVLERVVNLPAEKIWQAWTTPELIKEWFCPRPWIVSDCKLDLRLGGIFATTMKSPEGQEFPGSGCFLEIIPNEKLVWTDCLLPEFRPSEEGFMTAVILLERLDDKTTRYTAIARHKNVEGRKKHEEMGFHDGWGVCLEQLIELMSK